MTRNVLFARSFALLALLALLAGRATVRAQDEDPLIGTTAEALGSVPSSVSPDHVVVLLRLTLEPGATIDAHHHPGDVVLFVESGQFETTFTEGVATITRAPGDDGTAASEEATLGEEEILEPGDSVAYDTSTHHIMHNPGDEPLILIVSALLAGDEPGFLFDGEES